MRRIGQLQLENTGLWLHALQLAAKLLRLFPKVLLTQSLKAGANLANIGEADERLAELHHAHGLVVREHFEDRADLVEGASIHLGRGIGELVIGALRTAQERLRTI